MSLSLNLFKFLVRLVLIGCSVSLYLGYLPAAWTLLGTGAGAIYFECRGYDVL